MTILTILLISPALVLMINNKICIAWSVFGLLISGQKKFFPLLQISWLASLLMKHSYGGFILQAWRHFYMLWEPCVTCTSRSAFHLCNWEKFFSFNCPTCHCKLPLNTDSWMSFGKKIQVHCTESKTQKSACVALILMKMKPSWEYLEEGPPWIATTGLQVKSRDILGKWVWDQIFSLKLIEEQFLNYEEDEEDFGEKTAGQEALHMLKQSMKMFLLL